MYIFVSSELGAGLWSQKMKLQASDFSASDYFGSSVACTDNIIVVGSPNDDTPAGSDAGKYIPISSGCF